MRRLVAARTTRPRGATATRLIAVVTALRIVLAPAVMALIFAGEDLEVVAAVAFTVVAATDYVDGYLTRRWSITTALGAFLDTTADKLLVTFVLLALLAVDRVSPWIVAIIVGREIVLLGLRAVVAADGSVMKPSNWGRRKTAVQFVAVVLAILRPGDPIGGAYLDEWVMVVAAVVTVFSAVEYFKHSASALREGTT
jgi:CDP-diacylglycerol--glycerol-3-phosphate 3-phosphatidyltransferase